MTLRDQLAKEYVREGDCELFDTYDAHEATFLAGYDARDAEVAAFKYAADQNCIAANTYKAERDALAAQLAKTLDPSTNSTSGWVVKYQRESERANKLERALSYAKEQFSELNPTFAADEARREVERLENA